jgi:hypothetical protein
MQTGRAPCDPFICFHVVSPVILLFHTVYAKQMTIAM